MVIAMYSVFASPKRKARLLICWTPVLGRNNFLAKVIFKY